MRRNATATLEFSHISKSYVTGADAVKNFNLQVNDGEFITILGSSGSGKSTILRMVAGLETITSGELKIDGQVVNEWDPKKRNVAMVFQNYALFPNLTVEQNMEFALKMQHASKAERKEKVAKMAKILGVDDILTHKAKKLSGGQCQRIAIGRALVCEPNVFLMDEPLSNLDAAMRNELRGEIARLQEQLKITTLYVTHDQTEAMILGDRVLVMDQGEIQQVNEPQNIYSKPQNLFVAQFINGSTMSLLNAKCIKDKGAAAIEVQGNVIDLPDWKANALEENGYIGKDVIVGVRAEDVYLDHPDIPTPDTKMATVEGIVSATDVTGAEKKVHFKIQDAEIISMVRTSIPTNIGDTMLLKIAISQLHVFDSETKLAIVH